MHALVVFESMYGNTQAIAEAVAAGLSSRLAVDTVEVGSAPTEIGADVDLLVVGGPTHAFGMSRTGTRHDAAQHGDRPLISTSTGVREWLDALRPTTREAGAATFDTRIAKPRLPGSAARAAQKRLRRLGLHIVSPAKSFYVVDTVGPLAAGEVGRAHAWGEQLAVLAATGARDHAA